MKKTFICVTVLMLLVMLCGINVCYAENEKPTTQQFWDGFIESRNTNAECQYLVDSFGLVVGQGNVTKQKVVLYYNGDTEQIAYNVVVKIPSRANTLKQVIIGAHYDCVSGSQGANDNASGVTALYEIATSLSTSNLPFNVVLVAFCGEEQGLYGSFTYVTEMESRQYSFGTVADTLAMFNIDSIANGDNLYVQCENVNTDLANLITSFNTVTEKPHAVGTFDANYLDNWGYGYYEFVNNTDHTPFRFNDIPVANFFSGNFNVQVWNYAESADKSRNTLNSDNDTVQSLTDNGIDYIDKIHTVATTVVKTLSDNSFMSVVTNTKEQMVDLVFWYSPLIPKLIVVLALIVLAVFAWLYNRKIKKQAILGTTEVKNKKIFSTPSAEDIFSFKD